jgi:hypothetical protein
VPPDVRDEVVDFVRGFTLRTQLPQWWVLVKLAICPQQFFRWEKRYGAVNHHNGKIPRDHWTEDWERTGNRRQCSRSTSGIRSRGTGASPS